LGIPAGRLLALPVDPVAEPDVPDAEPDPPAPEVEPTVLPLLPDPEPLALVWLLSRAMLVLTSQHWLEAEPLDPMPDEDAPVPVPCAIANVERATSAAPGTAARQIFFIELSSLQNRRAAGDPSISICGARSAYHRRFFMADEASG